MSNVGLVECAGAPRDLGRDQGLAARAAVRGLAGGHDVLRRWLGLAGRGGRCAWRRDVRRYFPHQHEWLEGVARGAGVSDRALVRAAIFCLEAERDALLIGLEGESGATLLRSAPLHSNLRSVRPEGRFASVEFASPMLATPWIGVNGEGLAVTVSGGREPGPCAAHAALLARDCLERFDAVESALAWCLGRPAAGGASILLADASGEIAGILLTASGRSVRRPDGGVLTLGGGRSAEIAKQLAGVEDPEVALERALAAAAAEACRVDVGARQLRVSRDADPVSAA